MRGNKKNSNYNPISTGLICILQIGQEKWMEIGTLYCNEFWGIEEMKFSRDDILRSSLPLLRNIITLFLCKHSIRVANSNANRGHRKCSQLQLQYEKGIPVEKVGQVGSWGV